MASVVDICNSALNLLGASTISALTDDNKNARLCNQRYEPVRNRVFRSHAWNCLHKRIQLAQNSTAPVVEYSYAYFILVLPFALLEVWLFLKYFKSDNEKAWLPFFLITNFSMLAFMVAPLIDKWSPMLFQV